MRKTNGEKNAMQRHMETVKIADAKQVRSVISRLTSGKPLLRACHLAKIEPEAFWRRVLRDKMLRAELATAFIGKALDRADLVSSDGNVAGVAVFAKLVKEVAANLSPKNWGDTKTIDHHVNVTVQELSDEDLMLIARGAPALTIEHEDDDDEDNS